MKLFPDVLKRRWVATALVASLLLNGFLLGMMAADWLKPRRGFSGERFATFELRRFDERLPPEAVERIRAELAPLGPRLEAQLADLRSIRAEIIALAAEPQADREAIDARLAALRERASTMQEEVQRATYDSLLRLPAEVRAGLREAPDAS